MQHLIRWAGGKKWFIPFFKKYTANLRYNNYFEPFAGGATIFFSCVENHHSFLSDLNSDLIDTYKVIKEKPDELIALIDRMKISETDYYYYRDDYLYETDIEKAARFLYLNHVSFNGIYRVNSEGKYNVPYGKKITPYKTEVIRVAHDRLQNTDLAAGDFDIWKDTISEGDLVFLDPPYSVSSKKHENGFISYNAKLFSLEDQNRLKQFIDLIKERNAYYIMTNAHHEVIRTIFSNKNDICISLNRNCLIGGKNAKRCKVKEYIFTNIQNEFWEDEDGYLEPID